MSPWLGLLIAFTYIFGIIGAAEGLRRWRGYGSDFTRKVIHIGVGMLSWALPSLFSSPWPFVAACALFMVINLLDWRYGFFAAMSSADRSNLGTVYFPLAAAIVALLFWDRPPLMVAALMPLTWGDGLAPVVGRAFGRNHYSFMGHRRTVEGSTGLFMAALLFTWLALWLMPGSPELSATAALLPAFVVSLAAALVEAVSIWGLDNLTITATAVIIFAAWPF
jgi:phytol kinase